MLTAAFFTRVKASLFSGSLSQTQVDSLNAIAVECLKRNLSLAQTAYCMATPYHEASASLNPNISEGGLGKAGFYGQHKGAKSDHTVSNDYPYNTFYYYGRGLSQLTWLDNYLKMGKKRGKDYAGNPALLFTTAESAWVVVEGITAGDFTGKRLDMYINDKVTDFVSARHTYNGTNKADLIAGYARKFLIALEGNGLVYPTPPSNAPLPPVKPPVQGPSRPNGLWANLKNWWNGVKT